MLISVVTPAYNASDTIGRTLDSIFNAKINDDWKLEVIVVDDGSSDKNMLENVVLSYPVTSLIVKEKNCGVISARNSGINDSNGEIVILLDSDDELINDWPDVLREIIDEWPVETNLCYAACRNQVGIVTAHEPSYKGYLSLNDILNERHSGEYIPIFRGQYLRSKPYLDLGPGMACEVISYINYAKDAPFWITNRIFRVYHDAREGSLSHSWTNPEKAANTVQCYHELLERYGLLYKDHAQQNYRAKLLRLAIYLKLAGLPKSWATWRKGASLCVLNKTIATAILLILNVRLTAKVILWVKSIGLIRRYG